MQLSFPLQLLLLLLFHCPLTVAHIIYVQSKCCKERFGRIILGTIILSTSANENTYPFKNNKCMDGKTKMHLCLPTHTC